MKPKVLIATVPEMIKENDWKKLSEKSDVTYMEKDKISQEELLHVMKDYEYVM